MPQSSPSTRWCPTPEQLMILEEMYRSGVRTPNAAQIQQITAHLSNYGRIEGKNVFYWFQNHKARERQKLRRRLSRHYQLLYSLPPPPPHPLHHYCLHQQQQQERTHVLLSSPALTAPPTLHHQEAYWTKVETTAEGGGGGEDLASAATGFDEAFGEHEWTGTRAGVVNLIPSASSSSSSSQRPLRTLELFPTRSTGGLRDI